MGGAKIVPRSLKTKRNKRFLLIIDFPKFYPFTATEMALCVNIGPKCQIYQILFPLGSD
jgi:hypothetical protein